MRKYSVYSPVLILFTVFSFVFALSARADDDPPGRVARLNYIQGSISFQPGGESDWVQANPNRPLTTGDNLWADRGSRGELHIGSTSLRVGGETGITFLNLDDRTVQIQLAQGSLNVTVRRLDGGDDFEIDTPNLAFTLDRPGNYRVDVDPNGNATAITVRSGEGEATGAGDNYHLDSGESANFTGTDTLNYDGGQAGRPDDFDNWCRSRDDREERSQSARYVSRDVPGYDDLDDNGEWRSVPDYGEVWFPTHVDAGWAPYRNGHWAYVAPWGWTWVEDEPWGFAPFHYGRWAEFDNRWCWVPGPMVVRPVYAPALVVFVGGAHFGASVSFGGGGGGGVAWFPLGPREVYVPPYRVSERYVQRVNVTNTTVNVVNVTNVYNNTTVNNVTYMHQRNIGAVTAVSHDTFVNARPVAASNIRVNAQQMQGAQVQRNFAVAPVQRSVAGSGAPATARPPAAMMSRQVVVKETPAPPRPAFNNPAFNRNAPQQQQQRNFRQATAPPTQQQQQQRPQPGQQTPQQMGKQQRPGQFSQQPGQQPQSRQQMGNQPQQQQQQMQNQFPSRQNQQQPVQQAPPAQQPQPQMQQHQQNQFPSRQNPPQPVQPTPPPAQQQQQQMQQHQQMTPSQQQPQNQFPSRQNQQSTPAQPPPQQQQMQQRQQPTPPPPQQQQRPQFNQNNNPPADQRPPVKFAPPAKTNEDTYRPHQFERPQNAAPPAQVAPPPPPREQPREQPKPQEREQDNKKQGDPKDRK